MSVDELSLSADWACYSLSLWRLASQVWRTVLLQIMLPEVYFSFSRSSMISRSAQYVTLLWLRFRREGYCTKTIVLARIAYNIQGTINNVIIPNIINPTYWNWKGKAGLFWAGLYFICLVWSYFRLPEPKGRTYAELDILFEQKVSGQKFSSTRLNIFEDVAIVSIDDHAPVGAEKTGWWNIEKVDRTRKLDPYRHLFLFSSVFLIIFSMNKKVMNC